jgi:hypothetical protein
MGYKPVLVALKIVKLAVAITYVSNVMWDLNFQAHVILVVVQLAPIIAKPKMFA